MNNGNSRGRYQSFRGGGPGPGPMRGRGSRGRGRGRGMSDRNDSAEHTDGGFNSSMRGGRGGTSNRGDHHAPMKPNNRLVPVKPTGPSPLSSTTWRVLYVVPPSSRPEIGPAGEKIPGPFSPPLRPSTPDSALDVFQRKPRAELVRKENDVFVKKQRVQQVLQQAANSPSGGMGTYVGKLSKHNNPLIPVLPRLDPK
ncbi:hypothetical protein GGF43_006362 [Coemansia sp. RSA 2618]|nr:hypothetical protein GGF43_006362 [Coemansia sp. RSA 2618]